MMLLEWEFVGEVGVEAGTVAFWDEEILPVTHRLVLGGNIDEPPTAVVCNVGDDIDAGVEVDPAEPVMRVRLVFVDDVDEIQQDWTDVGELHVPSGQLVLSDPYCSPKVPYRQRLSVRPGRWRVEELYWEGDLEAVRLTWVGELDATATGSA